MKHSTAPDRAGALAAEEDTVYFPCASGLGLASKFGGKDSCAEFKIVTGAATAPELAPLASSINMTRMEPIPTDLLARMWAIFRAVYEKHHTEMFLYLGWNRKRNRYFISVPKAIVASAGFLRYSHDADKRCVGSFHSHGSMGAFYSTEDDRNEKGTSTTAPGLYGVMGNVMSDNPSVVLSVAGMGMRHDLGNMLPASIPKVQLSDRELQWWTRTFKVEAATYNSNGRVWDRDTGLLLVNYSRPADVPTYHTPNARTRTKEEKKKPRELAIANRIAAAIAAMYQHLKKNNLMCVEDFFDMCTDTVERAEMFKSFRSDLSDYIDNWYDNLRMDDVDLPAEGAQDNMNDDLDLSDTNYRHDYKRKTWVETDEEGEIWEHTRW